MWGWREGSAVKGQAYNQKYKRMWEGEANR